MNSELLDACLQYAEKASTIAVQEQEHLSAQVKADASYVTDVDLKLSELAFTELSRVVSERSIVTEEHLEHLDDLESEDPSDTVIFVDPIDGTRNYFHRMPLYGISVGVFQNRRPTIGVVSFPGLDELFFSDGEEAFFVEGAYRGKGEPRKLQPTEAELNKNSVLLLANSFIRNYRWSYDVCTPMVTACVALNSCWPTVGRGVGTIVNDHIWDFAGSWSILDRLGFELRGIESSERMSQYRGGDYDAETNRLKEPIIVSRPEHFEPIRLGIIEGAWTE